MNAMPPPLNALILMGGKSTRMGMDKAFMDFHGMPQWQYLHFLLKPRCAEVWLSVSPSADHSPFTGFNCLPDAVAEAGPLNGIITALRLAPKMAWLVVACDLPNIGADELNHLITNRNPQSLATAYFHPESDYPEPLIAIWEPSAQLLLETLLTEKPVPGPISILKRNECHRVYPQTSRALLNVNSPADWERWQKEAPPLITVAVTYFALMRAQTGKGSEQITTRAETALQLYHELQVRYPLSLKPASLKVAINDVFCPWDTPLHAHDKVVFIPPVSGG